MKRIYYFLASFAVLTFACKIATPATPPAVTNPPQVTLTPTVTQPPAPQPNVTCNELSLFVDPSLASGHDCKTVPESSDLSAPGFSLNPKYTELTLTGYVLSGRFFEAHISVYPVQRFSEIVPDPVPQRVAALQALIGGGPVGTDELPLLPVFNAAQQFHAKYHIVAFNNGSGIRFITQYSQFFDPINNHETFYTFQGLTGDGKYWISAILPISNPLLLADGNNPPNGQSQDDFNNNFPTYIVDLKTQLNNQGPDAYSPSITALDALIKSIQIQP